eukprot:gene11726-8071_t
MGCNNSTEEKKDAQNSLRRSSTAREHDHNGAPYHRDDPNSLNNISVSDNSGDGAANEPIMPARRNSQLLRNNGGGMAHEPASPLRRSGVMDNQNQHLVPSSQLQLHGPGFQREFSPDKIVLNAETGSCRLEARIRPGETMLFMQGEYNGFKTVYEGIPIA